MKIQKYAMTASMVAATLVFVGCGKDQAEQDTSDIHTMIENRADTTEESAALEEQTTETDSAAAPSTAPTDGSATLEQTEKASKQKNDTEKTMTATQDAKKTTEEQKAADDAMAKAAQKCVKEGGVYNSFAQKCFKN